MPWQRLQDSVAAWAQGALGLTDEDRGVVWADYNLQRPPLPYLSLQIASGPTRRGKDAELWPANLPATTTVRVLPSALETNLAGDPGLNLFVNGELFSYAAQPGDGVDDVRDDVVAQITASAQLGASAAPVGADSLLLTATDPGSLRYTTALGCVVTGETTQLVRITTGAREVRVRATAYGPEPLDASGVSVAEWIELLVEGQQNAELRLELARRGFRLTRVDALQQRLSAPSGPAQESRSAADLVFAFDIRRGKVISTWLDSVAVAVPVMDP